MQPMWKHQREGLARILSHKHYALWWGMGAGKTRVGVELANEMQGRVLIVCPKAVLPVWTSAIAGAAVANSHAWPDARVVVCNYESIWRGVSGRASIAQKWDAIICDESHKIKDKGSKACKHLCAMTATYRICLTGTPMPNSPLDVLGQFLFLDKGARFGKNKNNFLARFANQEPIRGVPYAKKVVSWKNLDAMQKTCEQITWTLKTDDIIDLPEAHHIQVPVDLPPFIKKAYKEMQKDCITNLCGETITAANAMVAICRLQQITSRGKIEALEQTLDSLSNVPVVVFAKYLDDINTITHSCLRNGRVCYKLCGERNELEKWQKSSGNEVIIVQIQAGSAGISLTRACDTIYYSIGHSLGDYEQSLARTRRPTQQNKCRYFHLIASGTIDERIYSALQNKSDIVKTVMGDGII